MQHATGRMWSDVARVGGVAVVVGSLMLALPSHASHTTFDNTVLRFELDGNPAGPLDGVPDLVDEFDDGNVGPNWYPLYGTSMEAGGALHLTSPGTHDSSTLGAYDLVLDRSDVFSTFFACDGGGSLVGTATWDAALATNNYVVMNLGVGSSLEDFEGVAIALSNWDAETASHVPWPAEGLRVVQIHTRIVDGVVQTLENFSVALDPQDVTGPVRLRVSLDDTTDTLTTSYSLDGGNTFESPFPPRSFTSFQTCAVFLLGADPVSPVVVPPCSDSDGDGLCNDVDPCTNNGGLKDLLDSPAPRLQLGRINADPAGGNDSLLLRGNFTLVDYLPLLPVQSAGVRVILQNGARETKLDATLPGGAYAGPGTRGWTLNQAGTKWTYRDKTSTPIAGIYQLSFLQNSTVGPWPRIRVQVNGKNATYPIVTGDEPANMTVVFGTSGATGGGGTRCTETGFTPGDCAFNAAGNRLACSR